MLSAFVPAMVLSFTMALTPSAGHAIDFSGKTVEIIMPSSEGSGTDKYARIFQPFLKKYLPGNPTVIVVGKPGGSGVKGSNWFEHSARRDGTMIISTGSSVQTSYVFAGKKIKFDVLGWNPIVLSPFGICFQARSETGVTGKDIVADVKALRKAGQAGRLLMGGKNATSSDLQSFIVYDLLGIPNVKPIYGLSSGNRRKAIARSEIELSMDSVLKCKKEHKKLTKQGVIVYMTLGFVTPDGAIVRDPVFPEFPHVGEAYEALNGKKPSGVEWSAIKNFLNMVVMANKGLWLPKGVSQDVVDLYVATLKKIYQDKQFIKLTKNQFGEYPQTFGAKGKEVVRNGADVPPETKKWIMKFIKNNLTGS
jgi:tripartite-type tricarboxylate transporter receptor subunit TctC